ncbi:MAG: hypothetical protein KA885_11545 [Spirochaetes bacterium]|nr:hypothetical protein [Spirochaetota bacterium]
MAKDENLRKIYFKTFITFFVIFISLLLFSFVYSNFSFNKITFHPQFFFDFFKANSVVIFFNNYFLCGLLFLTLTYSLIINREDLISKTGNKLFFYQISSRGLYLLVFLTIFYIIALEFIVPSALEKIDAIKNSSLRAGVSLRNGEEAYENKNYVDAAKFYNEFLSIINDNAIEEKFREAKNKIVLPKKMYANELKTILNSAKNESDKLFIKELYGNEINDYFYLKDNTSTEEKNRLWSILNGTEYFVNGDAPVEYKDDGLISDMITDYGQLAEIFFNKRDYLTAWYYYQYVVETDTAKSVEAKNKIYLIKKALKYQNSDFSDAELAEFMKNKESEIKNIYNLKKIAANYISLKEYQKAYFVYQDILGINRNLRDAINGMNLSRSELNKISAEYSDMEKAKKYVGKRNFAFLLDPYSTVYIGNIVKTYNDDFTYTYYLYDVKINYFDAKNNISKLIKADFGQMKTNYLATLYCFDISDRNREFFPTMTENGVTTVLKDKYLYTIPVDINTLYNFSYDYEKTLTFPIVKLLRLKNYKFAGTNNVGINMDFVKTAILDKISRYFIFFTLSLLAISLSWRLRSKYLGNFPILLYPILLVIPVFLYFVIKTVLYFSTLTYSILSGCLDFTILLIIAIAFHSILSAVAAIFLAVTLVE